MKATAANGIKCIQKSLEAMAKAVEEKDVHSCALLMTSAIATLACIPHALEKEIQRGKSAAMIDKLEETLARVEAMRETAERLEAESEIIQ
jgi:DNA replicative helicase MCM subunit Mcm2 (Cdc46/Mcm family)